MELLKKFATSVVAAAALALVFAAAAPATSHHPTGEFAPFGECPLNNVEINDCVYAVFGGSLTLGERTIPLVNPITLQGGYVGGSPEIQFYGAENGDTLSKTPQPVPGGLVGIPAPGWWPVWLQELYEEEIGKGHTGITATIELAAPATSITLNYENLLLEEGTALGLPVKVKLSNPIFGSNCYVGAGEPLPFDLTTGESGELDGFAGELTFNEEFTLITISGLELVNGTFAAPEAEGCGGTFAEYIDPFVDSIFGLPAGPEENAVTLEGNWKDASAEAVRNATMW
jgi:hypothetical protein